VTLAAHLFLDLPLYHALVLGLLVAPVSPAIVIPGLLELLQRSSSKRRKVLNALLVGSPLDNMLAVVLLDSALDVALAGGSVSPVFFGVLLWKIGMGLTSGVVFGTMLGEVLRRLGERGRGWGALLGLALVTAGVVTAGVLLHFSHVLAVLALGVALRHRAPLAWKALDQRLLRIWGVVQYAFFGLIGTAVDLDPVLSAGLILIAVILLGQLGRAVGTLLATTASGLSGRSRLACIMAYVPKATIQAAFATLALDRGLSSGGLVLTAGILAVVLTAPIGVLTLHRGVPWMLSDP
jgi:Kef-type K+ transport system membrane component KefB